VNYRANGLYCGSGLVYEQCGPNPLRICAVVAPEASSGRREVAGTASGQPTLAVTPVDPTAAAHTTADTATGGRRGAAAAEVRPSAIAENSTAATAVAAAAAAEVEDTAADSKSGSRVGYDASGRLYISSLIF
jgi:hypothetical protein